jgi:acetylornithine deacetylase
LTGTDGATEERVLAEIDRLAPELLDAVERAVRIASIEPKYPGQSYDELVGRESDVARLVSAVHAEAGAELDVFAIEAGRDNAVGVVHGAGGGRSLVFNGHIDVVPPGDPGSWSSGDAFSGAREGGRIWGRGSTDMKAGVLAQAYAAVALKRAGVRLAGDLTLAAVVGEEVGDHEAGTTATIRRGYTGDVAVIAEPTGPPFPLAIVPVTPGMLWFAVTVRGKAAHAGFRGETRHPTVYGSELGVNAIDKGFLMYQALSRLEEEWAETKRHPLFPNGKFGLLPGVIKGSPYGIDVPFFLSESVLIEYCVIFHPDDDCATTKAAIERQIELASALDPWLREHPPVVEWKLEWEPYNLPADHPIVPALAAAHERASAGTRLAGPARQHGFGGVCDATWYEAAGIPSVIYGPGDLRLAHAGDEYVEIDEVVTACKTFALLAMEWCGTA